MAYRLRPIERLEYWVLLDYDILGRLLNVTDVNLDLYVKQTLDCALVSPLCRRLGVFRIRPMRVKSKNLPHFYIPTRGAWAFRWELRYGGI